MKVKEKPQYSMRQCICFMLKTAWGSVRSVIWLSVAFALLSVGINLAQLFIAPLVLQKVENVSPLGELLATIGIFSAILMALNAALGYVDENIMYGRIDVRSEIIHMINHKAFTTSYPNIKDPKVLQLHSRALMHCDANDRPSEHIWHTLTGLLINGVGFVIYLCLLTDVNLILIGVVVITTVIGFFISRYINGWQYRHKDELMRYEKELGYLTGKTESVKLAKDIRIFGLAPWLNGIFNSTRRLAEAFSLRREKVYAWNCLVDAMRKKGYTDQELIAADLVGEKNGRIYDRFRNRLMFPIIDVRGNVIGFGGRVLDDSKPKYLNSNETVIFNKRKNLFGMN